MVDLRERLERFAADALCRLIGRDELRKLCLKIDKLPVEPVIFAVADCWRRFFIITAVVLADLRAQFLDALGSCLFVHAGQ